MFMTNSQENFQENSKSWLGGARARVDICLCVHLWVEGWALIGERYDTECKKLGAFVFIPYLILDRDDHSDEYIILGLGFASHVELLHAEAQTTDNRLTQVAVDAVKARVGDSRELSKLRDKLNC
jgi:hypothetical protein